MIRVLPHEHADELDVGAVNPRPDDEYLLLLSDRKYAFTSSGRAALTAVLADLGLTAADEVFITTTSGQTYVSSCVTSTVFNFCQPSRVIGDQTRAILIVHEHGIPHPRTVEFLRLAQDRGIPVIEDCAHAIDSRFRGQRIGTFGDYAIYSLPKVFPVRSGGLISAHRLPSLNTNAGRLDGLKDVEAAFHTWGPNLTFLSDRRRENYAALQALFKQPEAIVSKVDLVTPFCYRAIINAAAEIRSRTTEVEFLNTMQADWLLVPTNPMVAPERLTSAVLAALSASPKATLPALDQSDTIPPTCGASRLAS